MTQEIAKALDIWNIIKESLQFDDSEMVVGRVDVYLEVDQTDSVIIIRNYSSAKYPLVNGFKLTIDEAKQLYSHIDQMVELPKSIKSLHMVLDPNMYVEMTITCIAVLK